MVLLIVPCLDVVQIFSCFIVESVADIVFLWTCYKSLSLKKQEKEKQRERLVILGMLINIHEQLSLASIFKNDGVVVNCFIEA